MKVKRRTVWLLTLLSLAAVISVYYVFDPARDLDLATIWSDDALKETTLTGVDDKDIKTTSSESYLFDELRMEMSNKRDQVREQLTQKIGSNDYSAEEKSEAYNEINNLIEQESSEAMLEMLVKSLGYSDALVQVEDSKVSVTVLTDDNITSKQANEIIFTVRSELEDVIDVSVKASSDYY